MSFHIKLCLLLISLSCFFAVTETVHADLNAVAIRDEFNSLNMGKVLPGQEGFHFSFVETSNSLTLTTLTNLDNVDVNGYASGKGGMTPNGLSYFTTFCVAPRVDTASIGWGKLNLVETGAGSGQYRSYTSKDKYLTLGAAYLYMLYATGELEVVTAQQLDTFTTALHILMLIDTTPYWYNNVYVRNLIDASRDIAYWQEGYDPNRRYDELGDFSVFVMNVVDVNPNSNMYLFPAQDFLYLTKVPTTDIPEPATLLLWAAGGLGLACTSWSHKRRMKK